MKPLLNKKINLAESSIFFGGGVPQRRRDKVLLILDIREALSLTST